ncbi:hypothetical protein PENSPDRAFT_647548 [Peniophora sp. CONT]|nr:hypothetical protein PENSPDRAFT_647548 [Peniophora sp. CONT]
MSDNEIEYLGSMQAPSAAPSVPSSTTPPLVAGITLTVTGGDEPNRTLRFYNYPASREITIGRASSSSPRKMGGADGLHASFRCPVISRKHASIAFLDSRYVAITDLRSHHGTYVRKAGSPAGRSLLPNLAFQLNDGDFITFGKRVAKDDGYVDPVTVEVRLLEGGDGLNSYDADSYASRPMPTGPFSMGLSHSSSGRFGLTIGDVYSSSSSSEGELSDVDDAPEEIPIARGPALLDRLSVPVELPPMRSGLGKFIPLYNHEPSTSPELGDFSVAHMLNDYARDHSPFIVGAYPVSEDEREDIGRASSPFYTPGFLPLRFKEPIVTIDNSRAEEEEESMDMGSESGAELPADQPADAESSEAPHDVVQIDVAPVVEEPVGNPRIDALEARLTVLDDAIVNLRGNALRDHLEARKTHAADISRTDALGARIDELSKSVNQLREHVDEDDSAQYEDLMGELGDVRYQVEQLDDQVNDLRGDFDGTDDTTRDLEMRVDVLESMRIKSEEDDQKSHEEESQKLQGLVTEVRTLRDDFKRALDELAAERAQIQAERTAAQAERAAAQTESERSAPRKPKRKHGDLEDEDEGEGESTRALVRLRPRKRARKTAERVAGAVARGTAYAAVGAVAAWSALAFA